MTQPDPHADSGGTRGSRLPIVLAICGVIVLGSLLAFRPGLDGRFLNWDDDRNFVANSDYRGLGPDNLAWDWRTYHMGVWQPASWVLLGAEHLIAGVDEAGAPNPGVYHGFSIALHTANGLLLFALIVVLLRAVWRERTTRDETAIVLAAGAAALLFVVHPLRTEPALWISSQPYLPAVFFAMLGSIIYIRGHANRKDGRTAIGVWVLTFLCYGIAVLFKAVAVTLPILLLIVDVYPLRRLAIDQGSRLKRVARILIEKLPYVPVAILVAKFAAESKAVTEPGAAEGGLPLAVRAIQSCYGIVFYLAKSIVPTALSPFYELPRVLKGNDSGVAGLMRILADPRFGGAVVFVVIAVAALVAFRKRALPIAAALAAYVVILLPNLGLVPISQQLVADRYSYFASVPLAALLAGGVYRLLARGAVEMRRLRIIGVSLAVALLSLSLIRISRGYSLAWRSSDALWSYALRLDPESPHAHCNLGAALIGEGDYGAAEEHLRRAIELRSDFVFAYSNLAVVQMEQGKWRDAIDSYEKSLLVLDRLREPDQKKTLFGLAAARYSLGRRLTENGDWQGVVDCYQALLPDVDRLAPEFQARTYYGLAIAYFELGDQKQAWKWLREAQTHGIPDELVQEAVRRY